MTTRPPSEFAHRVDGNQAEIVAGLRKAGYYCRDMSRVGHGFLDLLVVSKSRIAVLFEVKTEKGRLTKKELEMFDEYPGYSYVIRSLEEALDRLAWLDAAKVELPVRRLENGT